MNFRRLVSAVAALAVAGTMCAGLAVTASAATETVYYVGSASGAETFDSYTNADGYWSSTTGSFSSSASASDNTHFGIVDDYDSYAQSNYMLSVDGSALSTSVRGKTTGTTTLTLPEKVTNGKLYFSSDVLNYSSTGYGAQQGMTLTFYDSSASAIATLTTSYSTSSSITLAGNNGNTLTSTGTTNVRSGGYAFSFNITIDLDEQSVSGTVDYYNASDSYAEVSESLIKGTDTVSDISASNISYVALSFTGNASQNNFAYALDNTLVYAETDPTLNPTYAVKINTNAYAKVTYNNTDYYANGNGVATLPAVDEGTEVSYTVSKTGYTSVSNTIDSVDVDNCEVTHYLTPEDSSIIYTENFDETGLSSGDTIFNVTNITRDGAISSVLYNNAWRIGATDASTGNGERKATIDIVPTIDASSAGAYKIEFDLSGLYHSSNKTADMTHTINFVDTNDVIVFGVTLLYDSTNSVGTGLKVNVGSNTETITTDAVAVDESLHVEAIIENGTVTVQAGDYDAVTLSQADGTEAKIQGVSVDDNKLMVVSIDNLVVSVAPSITVAQVEMGESVESGTATAPTVSTETKIYADDTDEETDYTYTGDGSDVTTIYAKITNPTTGVTPKIWVDGEEQESKWTAVSDDIDIYFAQFIGTLSEFGEIKITYDGAVEKVVQEATE